MQTFDTPEPITVTIDLVVGSAQITASDRADTVVEVYPADPADETDISAAQRTTVEFAMGRLSIRAPRRRALFSNKSEAVNVVVELPEGSRVDGSGTQVEFRCTGRLGECRLKTTDGHLLLDQIESARLTTGRGKIIVDQVLSRADLSTGSGDVSIREIYGPATIKNTNGATEVDLVTGDLRLNAANGDIFVGRIEADVVAKVNNGNVRIGAIATGSVDVETRNGDLDVGIPDGTAAWLDLNTETGRVRNFLTSSGAPEPTGKSAEVRARTHAGDIMIRRS
ncbi:DUF4097 family beta strand repeat-containing protein [Nocardia sp. CDC159]|uniref:DUF4097 family beta strand repeat-containing protein n=1 Tax=Nocardia pulmonis TaxID=2951408 RepID=A0A9X2IWV9_9NOCA|nr:MULTISPECIES: DUF4097 family beta strand repeat-containing protein [Nocardia]MCM6773185.1 DUF4097 family beta strand repeat-containing protein [Nocardia pulmonis]MCM6785512.1 DUF4097 family beta strand repeat-containing protein [Nocardia sp. CDC159]